MATQTTNYVDELKINKLTTAQYETIATPSATELYFVTDGTISYNDLVDKPTLGSMAAEDKNDYVAANAAITGATKTKITYDSKGLVTAGADLQASDIPNLSLSKISDVTATAAEVNKLANLPTTATELSYVHGVTDAIQTQLDDKVVKNTAITGATHTKITYDSKGLVTAGTDLVESDIPSLHLSKISDVTASATELNYVDGVTSSIQDQLNAKQATITGAATTVVSDDLTTDKVLVSSGSGKIAASSVTTTELGYIQGVTSDIQTQLNNKVETNSAITGATKCKITYDSKGLVTAGADLVASDIPSLNLSKISDVTATAAEVNVLDGITASTTELNYVDGVTSSIQTQLDNKVAKNADITGATKTKITYDSKGLVTAGEDLAESDIPSLHLSKISDVTASATELNYVDGVTSNIQNQIDSKQNELTAGTDLEIVSSSDSTVINFTNDTGYITGIDSTDVTNALGYTPVDPSDLATVATSGDYDDLIDKPTIGDATITIQKNGTAVDTFTTNATSDKSINITVPTTASDVGAVAANTAITGATKCKITYDSKGLVTSGADLQASDIPNITLSKISDITATASELNVLDGITASTAELNILDGVTATTSELNYVDGVTSNVQTQFNNITDKIPSAATSSNQLADKAFVNSSINAVAAYYITADAQGDAFATHAALVAGPYYYDGAIRTPTKNDYAIVASDEDHDNSCTRYTYTGSQWAFQYVVNETPMTQAQLDAINSGITSTKVGNYDTHIADTDIHVTTTDKNTWNGKQAAITGAATTITSSDLTASRALISNASGKVAVSDVTSTELGYLDGVTSNVQTQLNAKATDSNVVHTSGNETVAGTKSFTTRNGLKMSYEADGAGNGLQIYDSVNNDAHIHFHQFKDSYNTYYSRISNYAYNALAYLDLTVHEDGTTWFGLNVNRTMAPVPTEDTTISRQIDTVGARNTKIQAYAPNKDLSTLSSVGQNIANWSTNVTNCIAEIPHNLKFELASDGTLTLKSGGKIYMPNGKSGGQNIFDEITTTNDLTTTSNANTKLFVVYTSNGTLDTRLLSAHCSGSSDALAGIAWHTWYDTDNNLIKCYGSNGTTQSSTCSFPLAMITVSGGKITSIDHICNGFGYIGGTIFTLPGVLFVQPDGRNSDGTLKNKNLSAVSHVLVNSTARASTNGYLISASGGTIQKSSAQTNWYYDEENNYCVNKTNGDINWMIYGEYTTDANDIIQYFKTKEVFRAVDYDDLIDALPSQSGQSGKYLTTNGTSASWATVDALPSQAGQSGKYLTTNGTNASWVAIEEYTAAEVETLWNSL